MPEQNNQMCYACPANGYCPGGDIIIPNTTFWRMDANSSLILQCKTKEGCPYQLDLLENEKDNVSNSNKNFIKSPDFRFACAEGYEGNLCQACVRGYASVKNICLKCDASGKSLSIGLLVSGFFIYLLYVYVEENRSLEKQADIDIILMKILVKHISVCYFISLEG